MHLQYLYFIELIKAGVKNRHHSLIQFFHSACQFFFIIRHKDQITRCKLCVMICSKPVCFDLMLIYKRCCFKRQYSDLRQFLKRFCIDRKADCPSLSITIGAPPDREYSFRSRNCLSSST